MFVSTPSYFSTKASEKRLFVVMLVWRLLLTDPLILELSLFLIVSGTEFSEICEVFSDFIVFCDVSDSVSELRFKFFNRFICSSRFCFIFSRSFLYLFDEFIFKISETGEVQKNY